MLHRTFKKYIILVPLTVDVVGTAVVVVSTIVVVPLPLVVVSTITLVVVGGIVMVAVVFSCVVVSGIVDVVAGTVVVAENNHENPYCHLLETAQRRDTSTYIFIQTNLFPVDVDVENFEKENWD